MATPLVYITPISTADDVGPSQFIAFDSVLSLVPTYTKRITSYPVSDGAPISNHTVKSNPSFQMTAVITTQPLQNYNGNLVGYEDLKGRPQKCYDQLLQWYNDDVDVTLVFEQDVRSPLVITDLSPANPNGTDSLTFSISFEEVRRVSYSRVTLIQNASAGLLVSGKGNTGARGKTKDVSDKGWSKFYETLVELKDGAASISGQDEGE